MFDFIPCFCIVTVSPYMIREYEGSWWTGFIWSYGVTYAYLTDMNYYSHFELNNKTLSWYHRSSAGGQFNQENNVQNYIAIGI